ncbi:MAG: mandelate racemase/muconate lactonizing enzyme family protein [Ktedonobacteraceae bacterium]|nr:mandelate racemase/muconate lactonizing enzyme family protein [Ktedonobacteraceae bacterium]
MRTIQRIEVFPLRLPITGTFRFASGSAGAAGETAPLVLVRLTDSEGVTGWGEGRPMPQWSYETIETVTTTIRRYLGPIIQGMSITDRWGLHQRMQSAIGRGPSMGQPIARAIVDMALHDLCARVAGQPLRCYLGGSLERNSVALSYTLTTHDVEGVRREVEEAKTRGFRNFNFKVGVVPESDIAIAEAVRQTAGQGAFVWADANQGLRVQDAQAVVRGLAHVGVNVLEQPFAADQPHLLKRLRMIAPLPLAVDEASVGPADFFHYASEGLVDYLVIKVTRSGGIWPSLQQMAVAASAGLPLLVSGLTDGLLTRSAVCQLATVYGFDGPAALNGGQFLDETRLYPQKDELESGGVLRLNERAGIGIEPDPEGLERYLVKDL